MPKISKGAASTTTGTAEAYPTKELFIDTLVRDIDLEAAIVDLLDNCVDGAKRVRPNEDFSGLTVSLIVNPDAFKLHDNCGGISIDVAENYAFRFGRSAESKSAVKHSVGRFGVGMKRTLFKIAKSIEISSVSERSRFTLKLDIEKWKSTKDWTFPLIDVQRGKKQAANDIGTKIDINSIRPDAKKMFADEIFINSLRDSVRAAHRQAMEQGLSITFNGVELTPNPLYLLSSAKIKPYRDSGVFHVHGGTVNFKILAGIDDRDSESAGWYIYCNGRLLLTADQTEITGWGSADVQKFHQQFNMFRGYAFLDADDGALLPWNTTKTGVSEDAEVYDALLGKLRNAMREVNTFLNYRRREEKSETGDEPILKAIKAAKRMQVKTGDEFPECTSVFTWPKGKPQISNGPEMSRVSYKINKEALERVKSYLGVTTSTEVGERTFDYFIRAEME